MFRFPSFTFRFPFCRILSETSIYLTDLRLFGPSLSLLCPLLTSHSSLLLRFPVCETSRDKSMFFPRLPVGFTHQGYGCLLDFTAFSQLIRPLRLCTRFLFVRLRFCYPFISPVPHETNLGSRFRVRRQLRLSGLSPQSIDMPVILKKRLLPLFSAAIASISNDLKSIMCAPAPYRVLHRRRFRRLQEHRY